jgi:acyl-coenzyme A thioesterase PaaI-like protein
MLHGEARIVHQGSLTAVVRTRVEGENGRAVLEAVTHHARSDS